MDSRKGILAKVLEQGIRILLIKECKKIDHLKINLISTSIQIMKGEIQKIDIVAKNINYKYLLFDEVELEATQIKIISSLTNRELKLKGNPMIKFKISLSEQSLKKILLSRNWNSFGNRISKEILNHEKLKDLKISNDELLLEAFESNVLEHINIKTKNGKIYLVNKKNNKITKIPIEDKIYIKNIDIKNNSINIFANSPLSF